MKTLDTIILVSPLNRKKVVSYMKFLFYLFAAGLTNSKWQMNAFCFGIEKRKRFSDTWYNKLLVVYMQLEKNE